MTQSRPAKLCKGSSPLTFYAGRCHLLPIRANPPGQAEQQPIVAGVAEYPALSRNGEDGTNSYSPATKCQEEEKQQMCVK